MTDGTGQYVIENLRPGEYTVTFTLPGFAVVRREGVALQGTFNARINAELRVGGLEETITVTGETPMVDLQSTTRQEVLDRDILDTLPSSGSRTALGALIAGVDFRRQDVGGAGTAAPTGNMTAHGSYSEDAATTLNGISIASFGVGAATSVLSMNPMGVEEIQIDTGSNNAELHAGGVRTNYILKEGGNAFHGVVFGAYAPGGLQSDNLTDALRARGLPTPNSIKANWDINPGFGGPILQDRIWFYFAARYNENSEYAAGLYENKNLNNPNTWTFEPDTTRPVANEQKQPDAQLRVTWQATPRNKVGFTFVQHHLLLLPEHRLVHDCQGGLFACGLPGAASDRGRLDDAGHGPTAVRREGAVLRSAKQPFARDRPGSVDDQRAGAGHGHVVPRRQRRTGTSFRIWAISRGPRHT